MSKIKFIEIKPIGSKDEEAGVVCNPETGVCGVDPKEDPLKVKLESKFSRIRESKKRKETIGAFMLLAVIVGAIIVWKRRDEVTEEVFDSEMFI